MEQSIEALRRFNENENAIRENLQRERDSKKRVVDLMLAELETAKILDDDARISKAENYLQKAKVELSEAEENVKSCGPEEYADAVIEKSVERSEEIISAYVEQHSAVEEAKVAYLAEIDKLASLGAEYDHLKSKWEYARRFKHTSQNRVPGLSRATRAQCIVTFNNLGKI